MEYGILYIILACIVGLWMTWGIGANDLANIMSTAMGSRALSVRQALFIAILFEIAGAFLGGYEVSDTVRGGILNTTNYSLNSLSLIFGLLSVLLASASWITLASFLGMPVSITHAIVGGLVGMGSIMLGLQAVHWQTVGLIAISWFSSPIIAGIIAFLIFISIKQCILNKDMPLRAAKMYVPVYLIAVCFILSLMTILKGLNHFHVVMTFWHQSVIVSVTAFAIFLLGIFAMKQMRPKTKLYRRRLQFIYIEGMFSVLMALTACAMVFAHGSNDVAIAVGPIAGIIGLVKTGYVLQDGRLLASIMLFGCLGVLLGLFMYGRKVIETVGSAITTLTPSRAFAATIAAASTVVVSTGTGIPVSATQTLVGAVFGVGLARGIDALNLHVMRNIFLSWIITIPAAALFATGYFYLMRLIFI